MMIVYVFELSVATMAARGAYAGPILPRQEQVKEVLDGKNV
jgi:hypothetical protein